MAAREKARQLMMANMEVDSVVMELGTSIETKAPQASTNCNDLVTFITNQSRQLSITPAILATRTFCSRLTANDKCVDDLVTLGVHLHDMRLIEYGCLLQTIQKEFISIGVYLSWRLSQTQIMELKDIFTCSSEYQLKRVCGFIVTELSRYSCSQETPPLYRNQLIDDFAAVIFETITANTSGQDTPHSVSDIITESLLYPLITETYASDIDGVAFYSILDSFSSVPDSPPKTGLFKLILYHLINQPPLTNILECLSHQENFQFSSLSSSKSNLYDTILGAMGPTLSWEMIQGFILKNMKFNWSCVLSFISCFVQLHSNSIDLKGCIKEMIEEIFSETTPTFNECAFYRGLAVSRQACLEGAHVFPQYQDWFKQVFGDVPKTVIRSKKALSNLVKCLTECVPYDPPYCLKAHLIHPPKKILKFGYIVSEYLSLVQARLNELNESFVDSTASYSRQDGGQASELALADQEVQEQLEAYEKEKYQSVPSRVIELNIFNQPYFMGRFLKSLLAPRKIPSSPDTRARLIEAMTKKKLIPEKYIKKYHKDCMNLKAMSEGSPKHTGSLYDPLEFELQRVPRHIHDNEARFSGALSRLSMSIGSLVSECSRGESENRRAGVEPSSDTRDNDTVIELNAPCLQKWLTEICTLLLSCLCECVLKLCNCLSMSSDTPSVLFSPIRSFIKMLSGHVTIHKGLIILLWELLHIQLTNLTEEQILSLSVLLAELYISHTPYCSITIKQCHSSFQPLSSSKATTITSSSEYSMFVMSSLIHYTAVDGAICYGKVLCHFFHHLSLHRDSINKELCNDPRPIIELLLKFEYLQKRFKFALQYQSTVALPQYNSLCDVLKMIDKVSDQSFVQELHSSLHYKNDLVKSLQVEFIANSKTDYLSTPLQRHSFRRSLLAEATNAKPFDGLFQFLVLLKCSIEKGLYSCNDEHIPAVNYAEGIQLLQELSVSLLFNQVLSAHPLNFLLDLPLPFDRNDSCNTIISSSIVDILFTLPPYLFFTHSLSTGVISKTTLNTSIQILHTIAKPLYCHGLLLPFNLTCYIVKGIHQVSLIDTQCRNKALDHFTDSCPIFLGSLLFWWEEIKQCIDVSDSLHLFQAIDAASSTILQGTIISSPLLLSHCEAAGICAVGLISTSKLRGMTPTHLLANVCSTVSQESWIIKFQAIVMDCCARILLGSPTLLEYMGSNTNDSGLHVPTDTITNTITHLIGNYPSLWSVLLPENQTEGLDINQQQDYRKWLPTKPVEYHHILLIHVLTCCSQLVLKELVEEKGFIEWFFNAHASMLSSGGEEGGNRLLLSPDFVKSCSFLANFFIQNSTRMKLKECRSIAHKGLQPFIEDILFNT